MRELRDRLVLAAIGALPAVSCSDPPPPVHANAIGTSAPTAHEATGGEPIASADPRGAMTISQAPSAAPAASSATRPLASNEIPRTPPANCFNPYATARSVGTGEPGPRAPAESYDKNGCLPYTLVTTSCCVGAVAGPRYSADGFCCYTFPQNGPCCGRPFTVDGDARRAPVVRSSAWSTTRDTVVTRDARSERWLRDAVMEHASIASFARFVLDLLAIGAPASLVRDALVAGGDEIAHARLCFDVAARLSGVAHGSGPLDVVTSARARTLEEIVRDAVAEGCVGEAVAAEDAAARRDAEADPELRAALTKIATDEARHAALAWTFVRWIVDRDGAVAAAWVDRALGQARGADPVAQTRSG